MPIETINRKTKNNQINGPISYKSQNANDTRKQKQEKPLEWSVLTRVNDALPCNRLFSKQHKAERPANLHTWFWSTVLSLTHCWLNILPPRNILEDSNFDFRYVALCELDIPREKWLNYLQTMETQSRRRVLWRLLWVCAVCQLPF